MRDQDEKKNLNRCKETRKEGERKKKTKNKKILKKKVSWRSRKGTGSKQDTDRKRRGPL
jgi:hypothetical protein